MACNPLGVLCFHDISLSLRYVWLLPELHSIFDSWNVTVCCHLDRFADPPLRAVSPRVVFRFKNSERTSLLFLSPFRHHGFCFCKFLRFPNPFFHHLAFHESYVYSSPSLSFHFASFLCCTDVVLWPAFGRPSTETWLTNWAECGRSRVRRIILLHGIQNPIERINFTGLSLGSSRTSECCRQTQLSLQYHWKTSKGQTSSLLSGVVRLPPSLRFCECFQGGHFVTVNARTNQARTTTSRKK